VSSPFAWRPVAGLAGTVAALLVATSGGYGPHRDELYFVQAGRHPAWGYPDQPPLTPLLARLMDELVPGSLIALRLPSSLAIGALVVLAALVAHALGGGRGAQLLAGACTGVSTIAVTTGHLLSTTTFDLLAWAGVSLLLVRALRDGGPRWWLAAGAAAGIGLLNKQLVAFLLLGVLVGILAVGPRKVLRSPWPYAGGLLALALWAPHLAWQAREGWPALEVASSVAGGSSTSAEPPALFLPFQLVLVSPFLVPVWVAGLVRLWREPRLRCLAVAYPVLAVVFLLTGGKPYYLAGLYPLLLGAGAPAVVRWLGDRRPRQTLLGAGVAVSAAVSAVLALPLVPIDRLADTPVVDLNEDVGETVGWPAFTRAVAQAAAPLSSDYVVLTGNYGQAGAVDRYGPALGLPRAYSGHNGYAAWGTPPEQDLPVVAVGLPLDDLARWFATCREAARVDNGVRLENEEQGRPVHVCTGRRAPWVELWPQVRRLG
jgi:4-amino-4-deoxy-L-arabinose transferase-like glycosyltransferase